MEYIPHGPLRRFIPKNAGLPLEVVRIYAAQLVVFLEYLHSDLEVCHRDLKPGNIMIGDNLYLKIVSFNQSTLSLSLIVSPRAVLLCQD